MGKKYSINSAGLIVAERDIYSLGGFIPKGKTGGKIANENQLSQDGECWLDSGDISTFPNLKIKDNAFISGISQVTTYKNTDITISGDSRILGNISPSSLEECGRPSLTIHNSEISTIFSSVIFDKDGSKEPQFALVEQGDFNYEGAERGTPIENLKATSTSAVRRALALISSYHSRIVGIPSNITCTLIYTYIDVNNVEVYAGEYKRVTGGSIDLYNPTYSRCYAVFWNSSTMTPDSFYTYNVHIENYVTVRDYYIVSAAFYKPSSIVDSNLYIAETPDIQIISLAIAGGLYGCKRTVCEENSILLRKIFGTFYNIGYLFFAAITRNAESLIPNNDLVIRAYDCPLLRLESGTYSGIPLTEKEGLVLRNCIVPKAVFINNPIEGNTYENIDFSYAQKELGSHNNYKFISSHYQGMYDVTWPSFPYARIARLSGEHTFDPAKTVLRPRRTINIGEVSGYDYSLIPHLEGYCLVAGGNTVYGDVKLKGPEYRCLVMGENMFERGSLSGIKGLTFDMSKTEDISEYPRMRTIQLIEAKNGDRVTCDVGYFFQLNYFDKNQRYISASIWAAGLTIENVENVAYIAIIFKKSDTSTQTGDYISYLDIPLVKLTLLCVPEKRYYAANAGDIPSDGEGGKDPRYTLLGTGKYEQGDVSNSESNYGKTYEEIKSGTSATYIRPKHVINLPITNTTKRTVAEGFESIPVPFDALQRFEPFNILNAFNVYILKRTNNQPITPANLSETHLMIEYVPTPRIILGYNNAPSIVEGKIRMYDNSVLSGSVNNDNGKTIELHGDAVIGDNLTCVCGWGDE